MLIFERVDEIQLGFGSSHWGASQWPLCPRHSNPTRDANVRNFPSPLFSLAYVKTWIRAPPQMNTMKCYKLHRFTINSDSKQAWRLNFPWKVTLFKSKNCINSTPLFKALVQGVLIEADGSVFTTNLLCKVVWWIMSARAWLIKIVFPRYEIILTTCYMFS